MSGFLIDLFICVHVQWNLSIMVAYRPKFEAVIERWLLNRDISVWNYDA